MKRDTQLAYKLPVNDKAKFTALLVGITFAVFFMIAMTAPFGVRFWRDIDHITKYQRAITRTPIPGTCHRRAVASVR